eukprot:2582211-Prymnesium_polylepis.1
MARRGSRARDDEGGSREHNVRKVASRPHHTACVEQAAGVVAVAPVAIRPPLPWPRVGLVATVLW